MAHIEKPTGTHFSSPLYGEILTDREGLVGEYVFGGNEASSIINRADPNNPLTVLGAPVYNSDSVTVRSGDEVPTPGGFNTNIILHMQATLIIVHEHPLASSTGMLMGPNDERYSGIGYWANQPKAAHVTNSNNKGAFWERTDVAQNTPFFHASVYPLPETIGTSGSTGVGKGYHSGGGALIEVDAVVKGSTTPVVSGRTPAYLDGKEAHIGGPAMFDSRDDDQGGYVGYYAAIYQKPLTFAEMATAYAEAKAWLLANRGVSVE